MSDEPMIEVTIAAPVDAVWDALRDKQKIRHWHGWDYDGIDDEIDQIFFTEVTEDAGARTLDLRSGDRFRLEPHGDGTRITLTRVPRGGDPEWDAYYDDITEGWISFLHQLGFALERQAGAVRRTVFLAGYPGGSGSVADALGLGEVAGRPAGTRYAATLVGEDAEGEVWFQSDHQLGVTVDGWGAGLLIVAYTPESDAKPRGAAMAILSTYGLDDATYDGLSARWTTWWAQRYPE
jgi:uncharacterized protein YndB with AHSA1/START domain